MYRCLYIIFTVLSVIGELIFEKPGKLLYAFLILLSIIFKPFAIFLLISILCYAYRRKRYLSSVNFLRK